MDSSCEHKQFLFNTVKSRNKISTLNAMQLDANQNSTVTQTVLQNVIIMCI